MAQNQRNSGDRRSRSRSPDDESRRIRRKREHSSAETYADRAATAAGDTLIDLRNGNLDDDDTADEPDTVVDGMGAVVVGDEEDYGYFGISFPPGQFHGYSKLTCC